MPSVTGSEVAVLNTWKYYTMSVRHSESIRRLKGLCRQRTLLKELLKRALERLSDAEREDLLRQMRLVAGRPIMIDDMLHGGSALLAVLAPYVFSAIARQAAMGAAVGLRLAPGVLGPIGVAVGHPLCYARYRGSKSAWNYPRCRRSGTPASTPAVGRYGLIGPMQLDVLLQVPDRIREGLANGSLTAWGGTIRDAKGHIRALLTEGRGLQDTVGGSANSHSAEKVGFWIFRIFGRSGRGLPFVEKAGRRSRTGGGAFRPWLRCGDGGHDVRQGASMCGTGWGPSGGGVPAEFAEGNTGAGPSAADRSTGAPHLRVP